MTVIQVSEGEEGEAWLTLPEDLVEAIGQVHLEGETVESFVLDSMRDEIARRRRRRAGQRIETEAPQPLESIHPGEVLLEDFMKPKGISVDQLAAGIDVPPSFVRDLVEGAQSITADTAARLGRFFGMEAQFWLNLQAQHDRETVERGTRALREVLGDDLLAALLGVDVSSLQRCAVGEGAMPDDVAARLWWLAEVAGDLAGGYTEAGIRRWFERLRSQLEGLSPRQALGSGWSPDDQRAMGVRVLASELSGSQPPGAVLERAGPR